MVCHLGFVHDGKPAMIPTLHARVGDRKSTRLNSSHSQISYAVFCLKKKTVGREGGAGHSHLAGLRLDRHRVGRVQRDPDQNGDESHGAAPPDDDGQHYPGSVAPAPAGCGRGATDGARAGRCFGHQAASSSSVSDSESLPASRAAFFFNDTATTEIYTLSLHDALPISRG